MSSDFASRLHEGIDRFANDGKYRNLHGVVISRGDEVLAERYFEGTDERWGHSLGCVRFGPESLHDLRSVSKSVVGLLYGIALDEGLVPSLDRSLIECFTQHADLGADPLRRRMSVVHALSMQLGLEWNEDLPYFDPGNSENAMQRAPDRCRYVLEQAVIDEPGKRWRYNGGATALLAALIVKGAGVSLLEFARAKLFTPLGIDAVDWITGQDGVEVAASGLRMRPRDLAKLGHLVLNQGRIGSRQLVPAAWVAASLQPHARVDDDFDYGYHWWIARKWNWVAAFGNGGQRMTLLPRANLVIVVTAGNYNAADAWKVPVGVLVDVVLPALSP